jgi:hypothetical protein
MVGALVVIAGGIWAIRSLRRYFKIIEEAAVIDVPPAPARGGARPGIYEAGDEQAGEGEAGD